jgi:two-component SAPR family response regulator
MKNELNTCFQQKFATGSYRVGNGRAWCSQKACEICSLLVQKKKLKKIKISSHKLPKQQSTNFWSQGILGVNL